uniref:Uncharacterized protein n=1 Tax=Sus scrofa TaxID=9823 RepID=A0A8D0XYM6_PIG
KKKKKKKRERNRGGGSESMALQVLRALEGLKMMGKDQDRGLKVIPQTQRDLDRITRQVITAKKH